MTAPKPPDNKTLVGLPNELKAILERPRSSPPPQVVKGAQEPPPPAAAGQAPLQPKASMDRTLVGIPSEMQAALERALAEQAAGKARVRARPQPVASVQVEVPPTASGPVLRVHAVRTLGVSNASAEAVDAPAAPEQGSTSARRSAPPRSLPARPASGAGHRPPPQQLPPRPQARAQAHERQSAPPSAGGRTQERAGNGSGRPSGESPVQPPARRSASVPPLPGQAAAQSQPPTRASAPGQPASSRAATHASSTRPSRTSEPEASPSRAASGSLGQSQLTSQSELLAQSQITAAPFLAPNAPLNWPPARRRSEALSITRSGTDPRASLARSEADGSELSPQPTAARALASQPIAAEPSVIVTPDEPESQPELEQPAQHDEDDELADHSAEAQDARPKRPVFALPPGSANTKTSRTKAVVEAAPKRWPAIALIALAVVAFGCVIVLRAPSLLPAPLAAMIAPKPKHGASKTSEPSERAEGPSKLATAAAAALAPVAVKRIETDTSAATAQSLAPPSPTRPPASPPFTSGISAQLEKKAIDRLLADDYPAAKQAYERLRSAEPNRPEFGAMVELLTRASSSACGQPGQAPCAGAAP